MRTIAVILFLASLFAAGCDQPPMPPSDEEMIRNFTAHERAFNELKEVVSRCRYGSCYPPFDPRRLSEQDSLFLKELPKADRLLLDSLLGAIGCERVRFSGREERKEYYGLDTTRITLSLTYYAHGYSVGGTTKSIVYDPRLRESRTCRMTEQDDLNEIYRRRYNDTILYKRIKGNWYIMLLHDN